MSSLLKLTSEENLIKYLVKTCLLRSNNETADTNRVIMNYQNKNHTKKLHIQKNILYFK